ncbi:short-chain collagen C4-like [Saccostrea echinata]|uniref:short-chain collagen C4-like n=1 Tax=Saccostrea echinata TaxID=191078 RepID=UPI002A82280A|nr:short-chain collagen C4-like [Saccostrea echinata]
MHFVLGTTFVRWGKKSCPSVNGTSKVYSGIAGGRNFNEIGGGINTLCLPLDPEDAPYGVTAYVHSGRIHGSEYEFTYNNIAMDDDVPCAVCHSKYASSTIMIPAKLSCPSNWMKQYDGFLTSEAQYTNHNGADFLCLDRNPEYGTAGSRQNSYNGRLFYTVQAVCGSLPCPPYRSSQPIACVVCTM